MKLPDSAFAVERAASLVEAFPGRCREAGLAPTRQRLLVYRCLAESTDHPTADELYVRVREVLASVSLATVYRNLHAFAAAGIVDEVAAGGSSARFDANPERHHHCICSDCGSVRDVYGEELDSPGLEGRRVGGFEVRATRMNLYGLCEECLPAEPDRPL